MSDETKRRIEMKAFIKQLAAPPMNAEAVMGRGYLMGVIWAAIALVTTVTAYDLSQSPDFSWSACFCSSRALG